MDGYYEELFNNPQRLIEEMQAVITKTDDEIIEWLKANAEEYSAYTDAKKKQTEEGWQDLINEMKGIAKTYNSEINDLMNKTDTQIIDWLKTYNVEFANATSEQQESFLKSWDDTLEAWRNAYTDIGASVAAYNYTITAKQSNTSDGSASGAKLLRAYASGGLATHTGIAWLDGTKAKPERVLSSYQTELFEDLIQTLHEIKRINVGGIMSANAPETTQGSGGFNIESIQINVERLESDAD